MPNDSALAFYVERDHPTWSLVAAIDESESYDIDVAEIWRDGESLVLVTASGCSCWCGDYSDEAFSTLEAIEASVLGADSDDRRYNPSPRGLSYLMAMARSAGAV